MPVHYPENLGPKDGKKYAKAIIRISDHIHLTVGAVPILLNDMGRDTYSYYRIIGVRPYKKGEYYLDGSHHIANKATQDGEAHWVAVVLRRVSDD
jgi:hypothetical protein